MNVLTCGARGRRPSPPLRPLTELPARRGHDGRTNADGSRHAPSTVPRGTYAVDPEPSGAPFVPHPDPEWMAPNPEVRETGCCGVPGREGPNELCPGCGAETATPTAECTGPYEPHCLPDAVRVVPA